MFPTPRNISGMPNEHMFIKTPFLDVPSSSHLRTHSEPSMNNLTLQKEHQRRTKGTPKEHQRSTCELVYSIVTALYSQNNCRKIKRSECLVCSKQKDGFLLASVGYAPIMLGYWNGGAKRPTPLPLPLWRGDGPPPSFRGEEWGAYMR